MKFLQTVLYKFRFVAVFVFLLISGLSFGQPGGFNPDFDNENGGDGSEAPINDWIILTSLIAIGYGYYAIKKKSTVKA